MSEAVPAQGRTVPSAHSWVGQGSWSLCSDHLFFPFCSQVCLFLKRGANQHAVDGDGQDPLSIAVQAANADIVTL